MIYYVLKTAVDTLFKYKIHLCYAHGFFTYFYSKIQKHMTTKSEEQLPNLGPSKAHRNAHDYTAHTSFPHC